MDYQKLLPVLQQEDGSWIENEDWKLTNHKIGKRSNVKVDDYSLTLDMAKELSMVENNKIGRISRKYFIAIDKAFKARRLWNIDRRNAILG